MSNDKNSPCETQGPVALEAAERDDAFELYDLEVSVEGENFVCSHERGVAFEVIGENLVFHQKAFSLYALSALLPLLPAKQRMTSANDWMSTDALIACPDPHCGAKFRITRRGKRVFYHGECTVVPLCAEGEASDKKAR